MDRRLFGKSILGLVAAATAVSVVAPVSAEAAPMPVEAPVGTKPEVDRLESDFRPEVDRIPAAEQAQFRFRRRRRRIFIRRRRRVFFRRRRRW
jgi:hypothetical protein